MQTLNVVTDVYIEGGIKHSIKLTQCRFNVQCLKLSHKYCSKSVSKYEIPTINETWLRAGEISAIKLTLRIPLDLHGMKWMKVTSLCILVPNMLSNQCVILKPSTVEDHIGTLQRFSKDMIT